MNQRDTLARACYSADKAALASVEDAFSFAPKHRLSATARCVREAYARADKILALGFRIEEDDLAKKSLEALCGADFMIMRMGEELLEFGNFFRTSDFPNVKVAERCDRSAKAAFEFQSSLHPIIEKLSGEPDD